MKWLAQVSVFSITVAIGVLAGYISWNGLLPDREITVVQCPGNYTLQKPAGVLVTYEGFAKTDGEFSQWMRFRIHNGLTQPLEYWAHSTGGLMANIRVNEDEIPGVFRCGTGLRMFYLAPGSSVDVNVSSAEFIERPEKDGMVSIGFNLNGSQDGEAKIYWSDPLVLPDDFRLAIRDRNQTTIR
jgi:hypothetical protein